MEQEFVHKELTESIIGAAMAVLNTLRPGLDEKLYENALVIELIKRGHRVDQQQEYPVRYEGVLIGTLKAVTTFGSTITSSTTIRSGINDAHIAQMIGYLNITDLRVALLLNFKNASLKWKRIARQGRLSEDDLTTDNTDFTDKDR